MATTDILFKDYPLLTCAAMTVSPLIPLILSSLRKLVLATSYSFVQIIGSRVVANDTLSFIGKAYSLHHHLQAHLHQVSTLRTNPKIQADLVEALVGALCVQSGLQVALVFAKNVLRPFIQLAYQEAGSFHHPTSVLVVGNGVFEVAASSHADSGFGDEEEDDNGPGFDLNKGPSYVMALEEWKKERGATGREVAYMKGKSGGSSNEPLHSGSLVIRFNNVGKEFGPWDRRSWSEVQGRPAIVSSPVFSHSLRFFVRESSVD